MSKFRNRPIVLDLILCLKITYNMFAKIGRLGQLYAKNQRKKWHRKFLDNLRVEICEFLFFAFTVHKNREKKLGDKNGDVLYSPSVSV